MNLKEYIVTKRYGKTFKITLHIFADNHSKASEYFDDTIKILIQPKNLEEIIIKEVKP